MAMAAKTAPTFLFISITSSSPEIGRPAGIRSHGERSRNSSLSIRRTAPKADRRNRFTWRTAKNSAVALPKPRSFHRHLENPLLTSYPIYNAGPRHGSSYNDLRHWVEMPSGNRAVSAVPGRLQEHNFQYSDASATDGILYAVSGSGAESCALASVRRNMRRAHIAGFGWRAANFFRLKSMDVRRGFNRFRPGAIRN